MFDMLTDGFSHRVVSSIDMYCRDVPDVENRARNLFGEWSLTVCTNNSTVAQISQQITQRCTDV